MNTIELEDMATVFVSEFLKQHKRHIIRLQGLNPKDTPHVTIPFLKMSFARRKKLVGETLEKLSQLKNSP